MTQFTTYLSITTYIFVALLKLAGTVLFGLGIGWLSLDIFRKDAHPWQIQTAFFLGIIALLVACLLYSHLALGGFCLGAGAAMIRWGFPTAQKKEE